jgi:hypothetical protein
MILFFNGACLPSCSDWFIFGLGVLVTIGWAMFVFSLRPKLKISEPEFSKIDNRSIVIPVMNLSKHWKATRIIIEVCVIHNDTTYHLKTDSNDFAFIAENNKQNNFVRKFKAYQLSDYLIEVYPDFSFDSISNLLSEPAAKLRVRMHASHSFSGLGQTFEKHFVFKNKTFKQI